MILLKDQKSVGLSALEIIVDSLIVNKKPSGKEGAQQQSDFKSIILNDSNYLSLFLRLKDIYQTSYSGLSKEYEEIFAYRVLADRKNMKPLQGLVAR